MEHINKNAAMTVDVEDYFQVAAFDDVIPLEKWESYELRAADITLRMAEKFQQRGIKATFFILGWVAEKAPDMVPKLVDMGHEIASHGYWHQKADRQDPSTFFQDISAAKQLLEKQSGKAVLGYRAPSFSMGSHTPSHFDALAKAGYRYSSSTYPIKHDHYGDPSLPTSPYLMNTSCGELWEFPQSTISMKGKRLPVGGGGYFRLLPWKLYEKAISRYFDNSRAPYVFYFHPWECDPQQPRIKNASAKSRFRHYVNLNKMESKIDKLISRDDINWNTMASYFNAYQAGGE